LADRYEPKITNTDNPYIDNLVYYTKIFALDTVLKDLNAAVEHETLSTIRMSDIYIHCIEHTAIFDYFDFFPAEVISAAFSFIGMDVKATRSHIGGQDNYVPYIGINEYITGIKSIYDIPEDQAPTYGEQIFYYLYGYWAPTGIQLYRNPSCTVLVDVEIPDICDSNGITINDIELIKDGDYYYFQVGTTKYYIKPDDMDYRLNWYIVKDFNITVDLSNPEDNIRKVGMEVITDIATKLGIQINTSITLDPQDWMVVDLENHMQNYVGNKYLLQADLRNGTLDSPENYEANMAKLITAMEAYYVENYEEYNNYYRMLIGLPPLPEDVVNSYYNPDVDDVLENFEAYFPEGLTFNATDLATPIYQLSESNIELLNGYGLLNTFYESDPDLREDRRYMKYIAKEISLYKARKADNFAPLYVPSIVTMIDDIYKIRDTYIDRLNNKRLYVIKTIYSEAFKYDSKYYDDLIAILIILLAMNDTINRASEFVATKDIFDWRIVKALLEGHGVKYFDGMPIKYQIALCKNIQTILKEKSTAQCMKDILNIFGLSNIEIFRYFLVKRRKTDKDGNYITSLDGQGHHILSDEYDLVYLKVPIDESIDKYIRDTTNYISYDEITDDDPFWSRDASAVEIKQEILEQNFNYVFSKYISIDTYQQVQEASNMQSYIFTILYDKLRLEEYLTIKIPYIDSASMFKLSDVFTFLTIMTYLYYDTVDEIIENASDILYLDGFNFSYNMKYIENLIEDTLGTYKALSYISSNKSAYARVIYDEAFEDATEFVIPGQLTTIPGLISVYDSNMAVREKLLYRIMNANNLEEYRCYTAMYDALMKVKYTTEFFKEPVEYDTRVASVTTNMPIPPVIRSISNYQDKLTVYKNNEILVDKEDYNVDLATNTIVFKDALASGDVIVFNSYKGLYVDPDLGLPTYTEYLKNRDLILYNKIQQIIEDYPVNYTDGVPNESDLEARRNYIDSLTDQIIDTLSTYNLNITEFFPLFNGFSSSLKDLLQSYIRQVVDFFKSYKVQIYTFKQNYLVNNKLQSYIRPIDGLKYDTKNTLADMYRPADDFLLHIFTIKYPEESGKINPADYKDTILDNIHDSVYFTYTYTNND